MFDIAVSVSFVVRGAEQINRWMHRCATRQSNSMVWETDSLEVLRYRCNVCIYSSNIAVIGLFGLLDESSVVNIYRVQLVLAIYMYGSLVAVVASGALIRPTNQITDGHVLICWLFYCPACDLPGLPADSSTHYHLRQMVIFTSLQ